MLGIIEQDDPRAKIYVCKIDPKTTKMSHFGGTSTHFQQFYPGNATGKTFKGLKDPQMIKKGWYLDRQCNI